MKLRQARAVVLFTMATCFVAAFAFAQGKPPRKPPARPPAATARVPTTGRDAGAAGAGTGHEAPPPPAPTASPDAGVVESKTLDGGTRVFKFGEVEIEGRLRSPQIVYFLRVSESSPMNDRWPRSPAANSARTRRRK